MYTITCDGLPILDLRDDDYIVDSPRVKMEVNTVGEGSFKIFKTHPHYESMKKLKSVFEVRDDYGVIFRGRMTDSTTDFNNGKKVDLEGVLAYLNDSLIRPFSFPEDFLDNAAYNAAAKSGNVVEFLLGWIIEQHNNQVQPFQQFKLGRVTVSDPNNYLYRAREAGYVTGWEAVKTKLFDSALGGYLCIRYEADGNYIDYLEDFEEINTQEIVFGENLLDFLLEEDATGTFTAIVPYGAEIEGEEESELLTIESLADGNITEDIVKRGDTLYSRSGVERFGWIYAPINDTTWEDVTDAGNLQQKGVDYLENTAMFLANTIELSAADLHYTDDQIMSFRIYKKVKVVSKPHGLSELYRLTELEIPLMEPQGMKITVGDTRKTLLSMQKDEQYFTQQNMQVITEMLATVDKATRDAMKKLNVTDEMLLNWCHENDKTLIDGAKIFTGSVKAKQIDVIDLFAQYLSATNLHISGDSTMEGDVVCKEKLTISSEELASEADISMARSTYSMPNFLVRPDGTIIQNANARNIPFLVIDTAHGLKVVEAISCGDLVATRIGTTGDLTAMGNMKVAGTVLIHGGLDLTNQLALESGGTGASTADGARQSINYIGTNPISSVEEDTPAYWISKGTGVAFFSKEGLLNNQPNSYGFLFTQTTGASYVAQTFINMTGNSVIYTRAGNNSGWYQSGVWHKTFNDTHTIPLENGGTGSSSNLAEAAANAIVRKAGDGSAGLAVTTTNNGAFYATAENGYPQFGTLPRAQGGTGCTYRYDSVSVEFASGVTTNGSANSRYYPYLLMTFVRMAIPLSVALAKDTVTEVAQLGTTAGYITPLSTYCVNPFDAYVGTDGKVYVRPHEDIAAGSTLRISGWFTN